MAITSANTTLSATDLCKASAHFMHARSYATTARVFFASLVLFFGSAIGTVVTRKTRLAESARR